MVLFSFHTYDFVSHFVSTCTRILGVEGTHEGIVDHGKVTRVAVVRLTIQIFDIILFIYNLNHNLYLFIFWNFQFPIGIDPNRFIKACELPEVRQQMTELKERFAGKKVTDFFLI